MKKFLIATFIIIFIIFFIVGTVFSIYKFKVFNPISSCFGMLQILLTDAELVYTNGKEKVSVYRRTNAYYSIGIWNNSYEP